MTIIEMEAVNPGIGFGMQQPGKELQANVADGEVEQAIVAHAERVLGPITRRIPDLSGYQWTGVRSDN